MTTMQALVAHDRGGPEKLAFETIPRPQPGPDEVLIEVHAAAITFAELTWDQTWSHGPAIPSHEVSGVVVARGPAVDSPAVGDEVYALIRFDRDGAAAEYVAVPAADVAPRPRTVSHTVAAALPLAALTAWQALRDQAEVVAGEEILVHGGTGGVGAFVTQLAAHFGLTVTATVLPADVVEARSLGAARTIDVSAERFDWDARRYDVVIDTVGGDTLDRSYAVLKPGGRLVTLQAPPSVDRAAHYGVRALFFVVAPDRAELVEIARLVDERALKIKIAQTFPLSEGRAAFESGTTWDRPAGKTVLLVRDCPHTG